MKCLADDCDKEIENKSGRQKFCSNACKMRWHRKHPNKVTKFDLKVVYNELLDLAQKLSATTNKPAVYDSLQIKANYDEPKQYEQPQLSKKDIYKSKMSLAKNFGELASIVKQVEVDKDLAKWERTTLINEANFIRQDKGFYND